MIIILSGVIVILFGIVVTEIRAFEKAEGRFAAERKEWAAERGKLLTRIQDPVAAKSLDAPEPEGVPLYIPFDDDEAWETYSDERAAGVLE